MTDDRLRRWSPSRLDMIARCPRQFMYRYLEGLTQPPGIALCKGRGVDAGANCNYEQKIETHRDLPVHDVVDAAVAAYETEVAGGVQLDERDESVGSVEQAIGDGKDRTADLAKYWRMEAAPDYQPVFVQATFSLELGSVSLVGVIDWADDQGRVVDLKTTGKSVPKDAADESTQLTAYDWGYRQLSGGKAPTDLRLDNLVQTKSAKTYRTIQSTQRKKWHLEKLAARINAANELVEKGVFPPITTGWWCSANWCGYWYICPYGGKFQALGK